MCDPVGIKLSNHAIRHIVRYVLVPNLFRFNCFMCGNFQFQILFATFWPQNMLILIWPSIVCWFNYLFNAILNSLNAKKAIIYFDISIVFHVWRPKSGNKIGKWNLPHLKRSNPNKLCDETYLFKRRITWKDNCCFRLTASGSRRAWTQLVQTVIKMNVRY